MAKRGTLYVVSAPSGAGKKTVLDCALARDAGLERTVSATTRAPRPNEVDGRDYIFLAPDAFRRLIETGAFVEWAEVHGHLYGTLREDLDRRLESGKDVLLELDVQGMRSVKALYGDVATVFIAAPSYEELERRIRARGANDEASIALRMHNARQEMNARHEFDYVVVNEVAEDAAAELLAVFRGRRAETARQGQGDEAP